MKLHYVSPNSIKPAEYNPRHIGDDEFSKLCESVSTMGIIIPIIVNRSNSVIIAGHQRQKAAKAVGIESVPVFYADNVSLSDEVLFNQIHNGSDYDIGCTGRISRGDNSGWASVPPSENSCKTDCGAVTNEVIKLLQRYGNVLSCVAAMDGRVFKAAGYATACKLMNIDCNVYYVPDELLSYAEQAFSRNYGEFTYEHIEKHTWVQGLAQLNRSKEKRGMGRTAMSRLYEQLVIPELEKTDFVLDFGAGKANYAKMLNKDGYCVDPLEFYNNNGSSISTSMTKSQASKVFERVSSRGLYDKVVCDSVMNSVDSLDAERAVIATCSAFLKMGGALYISGRTAQSAERKNSMKRCTSITREITFPDKDGFTAVFRKGNFYYQKFHTDEQIRSLASEHGFYIEKFKSDSSAWRCKMVKQAESPWQEFGVRFEFTLPHPGGRYELDNQAMEAITKGRLISGS